MVSALRVTAPPTQIIAASRCSMWSQSVRVPTTKVLARPPVARRPPRSPPPWLRAPLGARGAAAPVRERARSARRQPGRWCRRHRRAPARLIRQFKQRGCALVSVKESWLNAAPEVQDVLIAFAGLMAQQESRRRSDRIKTGLDRRRAAGKPVGRQPGAAAKKPRKRAGYVASWESKRRAAHDARTRAPS